MTADPPADPPVFTCSWKVTGLDAAHVRAAGELDLAGRPVLLEALEAASLQARLLVLLLQDVRFVDWLGLSTLLDAQATARAGGLRLMLLGLRPQVQALLDLTQTRHLVPAIPASGPVQTPPAGSGPPFSNPVNAGIAAARVMAVLDRWMWLQSPSGHVRRVWAPERCRERHAPGLPVQIYLDERGSVNGWLNPISMLAVNQRHLDPGDGAPATGAAMVCEGRCGITWWAPAPDALQAHGEHCLTCAGPLARH